jgi:hypothetical protein
MDTHARWLSNPTDAYHDWQYRHAIGANRRLFSDRSVLQHCAMFDRFYRYLVEHRATLTTFTEADLMAFLDVISGQSSSPAVTTRHRYVKLIDRLCRHLVEIQQLIRIFSTSMKNRTRCCKREYLGRWTNWTKTLANCAIAR